MELCLAEWYGVSPVKCAFHPNIKSHFINSHISMGSNGIVDSLIPLLQHENFIKPYSDEHNLVLLLTKSF